jgi:phosphoribosylformylglycinamidine cyclo-ligase
MSDAYAAAGVNTSEADEAIGRLVSILRTIDTGRPSRSVLPSGHYASVIAIAPNLGIALSTDGVGSKLIVAEQAGRLDGVGVDCVAMNANDIVCVGAEPLAMLDYLAVERIDADAIEQIAIGLKRGAEAAAIEIPGGELAVLPELIRGHPSPHGFDLCGACFGTVGLDAIVTGADCEPGDVLIGLPSSGLHSNGYTLARRVLLDDAGLGLDAQPPALGGQTVADALLEPTVIYVRAIVELLRSAVPVHGLAHITGEGVMNLLRLSSEVGFEIDAPLPVPPICELICGLGDITPAEAYEVFNMGCGFVAVVPAARTLEAIAMLERQHPGTRAIGRVNAAAGTVTLPTLRVAGDRGGLREA